MQPVSLLFHQNDTNRIQSITINWLILKIDETGFCDFSLIFIEKILNQYWISINTGYSVILLVKIDVIRRQFYVTIDWSLIDWYQLIQLSNWHQLVLIDWLVFWWSIFINYVPGVVMMISKCITVCCCVCEWKYKILLHSYSVSWAAEMFTVHVT